MSKFYDLKQVADALNISVKALRIRVSKGKMPNADKREGDNLFWAQATLDKAKIYFDDIPEPDLNAGAVGKHIPFNIDPDDVTEEPVDANSVNLDTLYGAGRESLVTQSTFGHPGQAVGRMRDRQSIDVDNLSKLNQVVPL